MIPTVDLLGGKNEPVVQVKKEKAEKPIMMIEIEDSDDDAMAEYDQLEPPETLEDIEMRLAFLRHARL